MAYSKTALIPVDDGQWKEDATKKHEEASKAYLWRLLGTSQIDCGLLALLVAIAIAIGVGVGVSTRRFSLFGALKLQLTYGLVPPMLKQSILCDSTKAWNPQWLLFCGCYDI